LNLLPGVYIVSWKIRSQRKSEKCEERGAYEYTGVTETKEAKIKGKNCDQQILAYHEREKFGGGGVWGGIRFTE
jgi:hypothetical protein